MTEKCPFSIADLVPTGDEIRNMSHEERMKWARIVLRGEIIGEDVFKLARSFGGWHAK